MRIQYIHRLLICALVFLCACAKHVETISIRDMMFASECKNTCWAGIEPNITKKADALKILNDRYQNVEVEKFTEQLDFIKWTGNQDDWEKVGSITLKNGVTDYIFISLKTDKLTTTNFINEIGSPSLVSLAIESINHEPQCSGAMLLYPNKGIVLELLTTKNSIELKENQPVTSIIITEPWAPDERRFTDMAIYDWDSFEKYCYQ